MPRMACRVSSGLFPRARDLARLLLVLLCAGNLRAQEDERTLRVFLFAGQSNMVGADSRVEDIDSFPPFKGLGQPQPEVKFSYCIGREEKRESDGWVELAPVDGMVGPELSFARRVREHVRAPLAILKIASGGTSLGADWNPDAPAGFELYPLALKRVRAALADLERRKIAYRLEGFIWHQGENDMFDAGFEANYGKNLARFLECWRRDLGTPELRFYIGELCTKTIWGMDLRPHMHAISLGQRAVTEADPLADYVPTSHVGVEIGGGAGLHYHYGTLGQLEHGVNHADAYLRNIGKLPRDERPLAKWPYAHGSKVKLFVLAGHRNMEGERAFVQELKTLEKSVLQKELPAIAFRYSLGGGYKVSDGWEPLGPAGFYDTFGPELSFGATLENARTGALALAKFTHSGSQIVDWTPEGSEAASRNLYPSFLAFVRESIADLERRGHSVELAGIFYHLGENDTAFGPFRSQAVRWLASFVRQSRLDLGLPELDWYVSQQPPADDEGVRAIDVTAELAELTAKDEHLIHVRAFDLPGQEQALVLSTGGVLALGERLARAYLARR